MEWNRSFAVYVLVWFVCLFVCFLFPTSIWFTSPYSYYVDLNMCFDVLRTPEFAYTKFLGLILDDSFNMIKAFC